MKSFTLLPVTFLAFFLSWQEIGSQALFEPHHPWMENGAENTPQTSSFEGILVVQGIGGNATYYLKGDKVRSEMKDEEEEVIFLYSFNGESYTALMPSEKIFMEAPVQPLNFSDQDVKEISGCEGEVNKTAEKQTIQNIECEKWVSTCGKDRSEMWLTRELGFEWGQIFHPMYRAAYSGSMRHYGDLKGYFPMKMIAEDKRGRKEVLMEVVKLEKKVLGDELFSVPAGYRKMAGR